MRGNIEPYIERGLTELRGKSMRDVQIETALVWCGRACAAARMRRHDDAQEYAHEAIEHAALSGSNTLLSDVRAALVAHGIVV
jgi:hypothetical protein